jgi:hypothetical protein
MRLVTRLHERLAERFNWIQYPKPSAYLPRFTLWQRFQYLSRKQQAWVVFAIFWSTVCAMSLIGNIFF